MGILYNVIDSASLSNFEKTYNKFIKNKSQYSSYNLLKNNRFQSKYENIIPHWQLLQNLSYELVDGLKITGNVSAGEFLKQETQRKIFSDKFYTFYIRVKNPNSNFYIEIEYPENDVVNVDDLTATTKTVINLDDADGVKEYRAYFKTSDNDNINKITVTFCSKSNVNLTKEFIIQEVSFYEGYLDVTGITNESLFDLSVEYDDYQKYWKLTNDGENYYRILLDDTYFNDKIQTQIDNSISGITGNDILTKIKQVDGSGSGLDADLLDGHDSSYFAKNDLTNVDDEVILNKIKQVDGATSGLDADTLDGLDSSQFVRSDVDDVVNGNIEFKKNVTVDGSVSIVGNLEVSGTTTTVNTQELTVKDNIITLNSNLTTGTPPTTLKSGIEVLRGDSPKATFYWYENIERWQFEQPINLNQLWFNYPGNNTDNLGIYRHDVATNKTDLRIQIGDDASGDDKLVIGTAPSGNWQDLFKFYNNGNAEFSGNLQVNSISVNNSSTVTNLNADKLDGHDASYFADISLSNVSNNTILNKLKQVDGSGSGLDADLLDGKDSSQFLRSDVVGEVLTGTIISTNNANVDGDNFVVDTTNKSVSLFAFAVRRKGQNVGGIRIDGTVISKGHKVWTAGNDGSGSGLDADKLDGLHASSFLRRDTSSSPTQDEQFDLGNATHRWKNVYATTFQGTTLQAENADLAEKYTCKDKVEPGDIVQVSSNSNYEIEKCNEIASLKVVGVVSENPAFLMNKEENGIPIALKGKIKCKVLGPIRKGEPIVSYEDGIGISYYNLSQELLPQHIKFVGVALEDIEQDEMRKILVIL